MLRKLIVGSLKLPSWIAGTLIDIAKSCASTLTERSTQEILIKLRIKFIHWKIQSAIKKFCKKKRPQEGQQEIQQFINRLGFSLGKRELSIKKFSSIIRFFVKEKKGIITDINDFSVWNSEIDRIVQSFKNFITPIENSYEDISNDNEKKKTQDKDNILADELANIFYKNLQAVQSEYNLLLNSFLEVHKIGERTESILSKIEQSKDYDQLLSIFDKMEQNIYSYNSDSEQNFTEILKNHSKIFNDIEVLTDFTKNVLTEKIETISLDIVFGDQKIIQELQKQQKNSSKMLEFIERSSTEIIQSIINQTEVLQTGQREIKGEIIDEHKDTRAHITDEIAKLRSLPESSISKLKDNYNLVMQPDEPPEFFRGFDTFQVGMVYDQDIPDLVIKIDFLYQEINSKFDGGFHICLNGSTGLSKTTHAKMLLKDKKDTHHIYIIENSKNIENLTEESFSTMISTEKPWIIMIDDLHMYSADHLGKINLILSNSPKNKIKLIITSRISLQTLQRDHKDNKNAVRFLQKFKQGEILCSGEKFQNSHENSEKKLLEVFNHSNNNKFTSEQLQTIYNDFHGNYIFLGYALKYGDPTSSNLFEEVYKNIKRKVETLFDLIDLENMGDKDKELYFSTFLAICFRSLFDDPVSKNDFDGENIDFNNILENLKRIGLIQKNIVENTYRISHARLAQLIIQASKDGIFDLDPHSVRLRLTSIKIRNYKLLSEDIWNFFFSQASFLKKLDISWNQLTKLPTSIGDLINLKELDLSMNQLTKLPTSIGDLINLKELDLSMNKLTRLPTWIGNFTALEKLALWDNQLTKLPSSIGNLTNLKELNLNFNQLPELPESFGNLTNLKKLNIRDYGLTILPEIVTKMTWLESLNIDGNELSELPEGIGDLTNLKELWLNDNQLSELPESFGNLTNLKELNLNFNQLPELPESFGNLTNLKELYLYDNQLTKLPESIGGLKALEITDLQHNQLTKLPESIGGLTNLKELLLNDNQLSELTEEIGGLKNLKKLILYSNQLSELPESIGDLTALELIDLGINQLSILPAAIGHLSNLKELWLSLPQLSELPESIGNLTNLKKLMLVSDQLTKLPESIVNLTNLQDLTLASKKWTTVLETIKTWLKDLRKRGMSFCATNYGSQ